jgi:hypothetical protein
MFIDSTLVISVGSSCEMVFSNANSAGYTVMLSDGCDCETAAWFPTTAVYTLMLFDGCGRGTVSWFAAFLVFNLMLSSGVVELHPGLPFLLAPHWCCLDGCGFGAASWSSTSVGLSVVVKVICNCEAISCTVSSVCSTVAVPNGCRIVFITDATVGSIMVLSVASPFSYILVPPDDTVVPYFIWIAVWLLWAENPAFTILLLNDKQQQEQIEVK